MELIIHIGYDIINNLRSHPENLAAANLWLNTYLDEFLNIVKKSGDLTQRGYLLPATDPIMIEIDATLDSVQNLFHAVLNKIEKRDREDLELDMKVLRTMIKDEGV